MSTEQATVVIGAGLGGLCCGALLATSGVPVTVVERGHAPGGYARSFERGDGRFEFEISLHGTTINDNDSARTLERLGVLDRLELVQLPEVYRLVSPTLDISVPNRDPEAYIEVLARHFPDEADGIRNVVGQMIQVAEEADRFDRSRGEVDFTQFPVTFPAMWDIRNKTLAEFLADHVDDESLTEALAGLWSYYGLPPSELSAFYYAAQTGQYLDKGSFYIKPRSRALSEALAEVIEANGGQVTYFSPATEILVSDGAVTGVRLADDRVLPATTVVSNASAITTLTELVPEAALPEDYRARLSALRPSVSCVMVWLGLDRALRGEVEGYSTHVTTGAGPEAEYAAGVRGDPDHVGFSVTVYDNAFEGYSRPGTSTVMLFCPSGWEAWQPFEHDFQADGRVGYEKEKRRWRDALVRRAEDQVIPGLSSMIDVEVTATPLTNRAFTGNTEGAIYGFEQIIDNAYMTRLPNETPVKGLYLASAWGNPGGGFGGAMAGAKAAFDSITASWADD